MTNKNKTYLTSVYNHKHEVIFVAISPNLIIARHFEMVAKSIYLNMFGNEFAYTITF